MFLRPFLEASRAGIEPAGYREAAGGSSEAKHRET